jgi:SAM-dependent methyltransferase
MKRESWTPYETALWDYFTTDKNVTLVVHSNDLTMDLVPVSVFFRTERKFPYLEKVALNLCSGRILDIGAGAGAHALALQKRGFSVCGIDIAPKVVEIMKKRGVKEAHCRNIFDFSDGKFDTLLMLMNGMGVVGNMNGLERFLEHAKTLIAPKGHIIFDSSDVRYTKDIMQLRYQDQKRKSDEYFGEYTFQFEYKHHLGEKFDWLFVDSQTMTRFAEKHGWNVAGIYQYEKDHYVMKLELEIR